MISGTYQRYQVTTLTFRIIRIIFFITLGYYLTRSIGHNVQQENTNRCRSTLQFLLNI